MHRNPIAYLPGRADPRAGQHCRQPAGSEPGSTPPPLRPGPSSRMAPCTRSGRAPADFCAIYLRGVQSFNDLDAVSKLRFSSFLNRFFKNFQAMYFSHRDGVLNASLWGEVERTMSDVIAYPGTQQWWETRRHWHTEEFGRVIDAIIARGDKPTAYSTYNLSETGLPKYI